MSSVESIINRQVLRWNLLREEQAKHADKSRATEPIITISRQHGSRGSYLAERVAAIMDYSVLDKSLCEQIVRSSGYQTRIVEALDEKVRGEISAMVEGAIFGQTIDHADYHRQLYEVIISLSSSGGVVVLGRGANIVMGREHGLHVRVICPLERRIQYLMKYSKIDRATAEREIALSDKERADYIWKLFRLSIDDPELYDITINTDLIDIEEAAPTIVTAARGKFDKLRYLFHDSAQQSPDNA